MSHSGRVISCFLLVAIPLASVSLGTAIRWRRYVRSPLPDAAMYRQRARDTEGIAVDVEVNRPGIENPRFLNAHDGEIANSLNVIGLVVNGQAYAYSVNALSVPMNWADESALRELARRHVVNQLLGSTAISVTYCDLSKCARVFKRDNQSQVLALGVRGGCKRKLVLSYADREYMQDSREIPLADHPYEVTSWSDWLSRHPGTLIYLGP